MAKSTRAAARRKPRATLWLHSGSGQWAKKIRGKVYYFGTNFDEALRRYMRVRDDLEAGRPLRSWSTADIDGLTLIELCNHFAAHKKHQVAIGELSPRSLADYVATCERLMSHFGKGVVVDQLHPSDLLAYRRVIAEKWGIHALGNEVARARVVLRFAFEAGLIKHPIRFGEFRRPKKAAIRKERDAAGERMFESAELRQIIEAAGPHLKAMIFLGLNCGFGNADCGTLPRSALDLDTGWITYPRPKTGVVRRAKLWPETVEALRKSLELRPQERTTEDEGIVFLTRRRARWHNGAEGSAQSALSLEFRKLLLKLGLYRKGRSFYTLRHVFQTVGDETGDETAVRMIMGHADNSMSATYRERFPDARLTLVAEHVRAWLFPKSHDSEITSPTAGPTNVERATEAIVAAAKAGAKE
jgi:integrase